MSSDQGTHIAEQVANNRPSNGAGSNGNTNAHTYTPSKHAGSSSSSAAGGSANGKSINNRKRTASSGSTSSKVSAAGSAASSSGHGTGANTHNSSSTSNSISNRDRTASTEQRASALEEQVLEETEMLAAIRDMSLHGRIQQAVMFIVHCSFIDDVVIYVPAQDEVEVLNCKKITQAGTGSGDEIIPVELTNFEFMMTYGPKLVPNHEREYPHVREMIMPYFVENDMFGGGDGSEDDGGGSSQAVYTPQHNRHQHQQKNSSQIVGALVGAIQLPIMPDVIVDVWRAADGKAWATTTVDGVSFAVMERVFMMSESKWGVSQVVQVDIFGRHPAKGYLVVEHVTA